ncbi:MAG TPA: hypothetical protein PL114_08365 [Bacteroidales bacterium]|jgi:predicted membrane protein|nr:MAG: hypothetical protein BWX77_00902 [Bacteroidetes bacterium ADurb.Bin090]HOD26798.1 hypothetical protein [Bacteroidales bacterium]HPN47926.1 hypothetical protein [Bacteroidales bacterium]
MMDSLIELFKSMPIIFILGAIYLVIIFPIFTIAVLTTDFTAEGQRKAKKKNNPKDDTITLRVVITTLKEPDSTLDYEKSNQPGVVITEPKESDSTPVS